MRRIAVRTSLIHGRGVFALTNLAAGDPIIEYKGEIITAREAQRRVDRSRAVDGHTFFFNLEDGRMIDGAQGGNSARWINHSCAPNCEAEQEGDRIFIRATRKIEAGRELFIDYQLDVEGRRTAALKRMYACRSVPAAVAERCSKRAAESASAASNTTQEFVVRRTAENKLKVVAVRIDPQIEQRLRLLAETTGRKQSFFLQQMIERGIEAMEATWLPPEAVAQIRNGEVPQRPKASATRDLFSN